MTGYVVDASVAVEYLLRTPLGLMVADVIDDALLVAPELMDAEVLSVLRRAVLNGHLAEARALMALDDLVAWPVERVSHQSLTRLAWQHHQNVSAYDAFYIAVAPHPRSAVCSLPTAGCHGQRGWVSKCSTFACDEAAALTLALSRGERG